MNVHRLFQKLLGIGVSSEDAFILFRCGGCILSLSIV
jgi:hypothetical protein